VQKADELIFDTIVLLNKIETNYGGFCQTIQLDGCAAPHMKVPITFKKTSFKVKVNIVPRGLR
jgi:hypothetical protein